MTILFNEEILEAFENTRENLRPIVRWVTSITRKEEKEIGDKLKSLGLSYGMDLEHYYDYGKGVHLYPWELDKLDESEYILFEKKTSSYKRTEKISIKGVENGIVMRKYSFLATVPKKSEYGNIEPLFCEGEVYVTKDKKFFSNYTPGIYGEKARIYSTYCPEGILDARLNYRSKEAITTVPKSWDEVFEEEIAHIFPEAHTLSGTRVVDNKEDYLAFLRFLSYEEVTVKGGPRQEAVSELSAYPLRPISFYKKEAAESREAYYAEVEAAKKRLEGYIPRLNNGQWLARFFVVEHVEACENKKVLAVRYFTSNDQLGIYEISRIYVDGKDDYYPCKKNLNGEWVYVNITSNTSNWRGRGFLPEDKNTIKDTMLEYLKLDPLNPDSFGRAMYSLLKYPILDQFCSLGYQEEIFNIPSWKEPIDRVKSLFGEEIDDSKKGLFSKLGVNKHQFEYAMKMASAGDVNKLNGNSGIEFIPHLKTVVKAAGIDSLSSIENETFDKISELIITHNERSAQYFRLPFEDRSKNSIVSMRVLIDVMKNMVANYSLATLANNVDMLKEMMGWVVKNDDPVREIYFDSQAAMVYYDDYLKMIVQMKDARFPLKVTSPEDVKVFHDSAAELYNLKKETIKMEQFEKVVENMEKLEYENPELGYSIVAPKSPSEIVIEGRKLRHCVAVYADLVVDGETRIVFLRKNSELDKPFFTVEVLNNDSVRQVHGFGNSPLSSAPEEAIMFFNEWVKEKKLKLENINRCL